MSKQAVSITLDVDNLTWLKGQARATAGRGLSEFMDRLVTRARTEGHGHPAGIRSVRGTVKIAPADPDLRTADAALRRLFPATLEKSPLRRRKVTRRT